MSRVRVPIEEICAAVRGLRVGLLTNGTFWLEEAGDDLTGLVKGACRELVVLYSEHGPRGCEGGGEAGARDFDPYLGCEVRLLPLLSDHRDSDLVADLDLLIVGMPDIGCRHYTYKASASHLLELAAQVGRPVVVVDFPTPVGGALVEGNFPDPAYYPKMAAQEDQTFAWSWFGAPLTYRHGMTMGELALYAREHLKLELDLRVLKLAGWRREFWWSDTGWPYIPQDPTITAHDTPGYFLCTGLFQGTTLSWGIGASEPFRVLGAPWIEDDRLLRALRAHNLPGLTFSRAAYMPRWSGEQNLWGRYAYEVCNGVRLHITDRQALRTAQVQITLLVEMFRLYPDQFRFEHFDFFGTNDRTDHGPTDHRLEDEQWTNRLEAGEGVEAIWSEWQAASREFDARRQPYLLY